MKIELSNYEQKMIVDSLNTRIHHVEKLIKGWYESTDDTSKKLVAIYTEELSKLNSLLNRLLAENEVEAYI